MSKQSRKHLIGFAGEFLVAGDLLRLGVMAALTYGNAKNKMECRYHSRFTVLC